MQQIALQRIDYNGINYNAASSDAEVSKLRRTAPGGTGALESMRSPRPQLPGHFTTLADWGAVADMRFKVISAKGLENQKSTLHNPPCAQRYRSGWVFAQRYWSGWVLYRRCFVPRTVTNVRLK